MLEQIKEAIKEVYESEAFPLVWLVSFVIMVGLSTDDLWLLPGIGGFAYFVKTRWMDR